MARSRRTGRSRFTLILLVLASLTLLTLDFRDSGPVTALRNVAGTVFDPVRSAGNAIGRPFGNAWDGASGHDKLKKENERLRSQIDALKAQQVGFEVAVRQNKSLQDQLDLNKASHIPTVAARIVSGPLTSFTETLEINRGSGDGVKQGMAVVTKAGLVGRVARVTGGRSTIQLITDPSFRFGIRLAKLANLGLARGGGRSGLIEVDEGIAATVAVRRGEFLVTSGQSESPFPPDVPVGRVLSVGTTADRVDHTLVVRPIADLRALTYVSVLLCDNNCS